MSPVLLLPFSVDLFQLPLSRSSVTFTVINAMVTSQPSCYFISSIWHSQLFFSILIHFLPWLWDPSHSWLSPYSPVALSESPLPVSTPSPSPLNNAVTLGLDHVSQPTLTCQEVIQPKVLNTTWVPMSPKFTSSAQPLPQTPDSCVWPLTCHLHLNIKWTLQLKCVQTWSP